MGRKHHGKGEIARDEQFLLFPKCFQKTYTADTQKPGLVWERIKPLCHRAWVTCDKVTGLATKCNDIFLNIEQENIDA